MLLAKQEGGLIQPSRESQQQGESNIPRTTTSDTETQQLSLKVTQLKTLVLSQWKGEGMWEWKMGQSSRGPRGASRAPLSPGYIPHEMSFFLMMASCHNSILLSSALTPTPQLWLSLLPPCLPSLSLYLSHLSSRPSHPTAHEKPAPKGPKGA